MSIQKFKDGAILMTGDDMWNFLMGDRTLALPSCEICSNKDDELCPDCSMNDTDRSCSCHINPPCSKCIDNHYERSPYAVDYLLYGATGKTWHGFIASEQTYGKWKEFKKQGYFLNIEIMQMTGEAVLYLTKSDEDIVIEICEKKGINNGFEKILQNYSIPEVPR